MIIIWLLSKGISVNLDCFGCISDRTSDFNSREVGMELAQSTVFDPTLDGMVLDTEKWSDELI